MKPNNNKEVAVISGGTGYVGSVIGKKLADSGFTVVEISKTGKAANSEREHIEYFASDITDSDSVEKTAKEVKKRFGAISAVIHCASAPLVRKTILSESREEFESQFKVNVTGAFNLFKFFVPLLSANGSVIGITSKSIASENSYPKSGSYIPAKLALSGFLRVLRAELKSTPIRVYGVAPAFMPGGLNKDVPREVVEFIKKKSLPGEITGPEEVAEVVLQLINDTAKEMDGKSIDVPSRKTTNL